MKAVLFEQHGGPEVLQYTDFPAPEPGPGQVQVQIHAAAMNRLDMWVRNGWPGIRLEYPHIPGADGAGVISAIGPGVTSCHVGDRVVINSNLSDGTCEFCQAGQDNMCARWALLGETVRGTYAEYVVVPDRNVLTLPVDFPFDQAAAASLVFLTAWHSLITRGQLQRGESVLIVGAGGGVNTASLQIAKYIGAKVYVVGSNMAKLKRAEELGADELIDRSRDADWSKAIYSLTNKRGVDVVVDNVGRGHAAVEPARRPQRRTHPHGGQHRRPQVRVRQSLHVRQAADLHRIDDGHARRFCAGDGADLCGQTALRDR